MLILLSNIYVLGAILNTFLLDKLCTNFFKRLLLFPLCICGNWGIECLSNLCKSHLVHCRTLESSQNGLTLQSDLLTTGLMCLPVSLRSNASSPQRDWGHIVSVKALRNPWEQHNKHQWEHSPLLYPLVPKFNWPQVPSPQSSGSLGKIHREEHCPKSWIGFIRQFS
jgi:hypothetical protein